MEQRRNEIRYGSMVEEVRLHRQENRLFPNIKRTNLSEEVTVRTGSGSQEPLSVSKVGLAQSRVGRTGRHLPDRKQQHHRHAISKHDFPVRFGLESRNQPELQKPNVRPNISNVNIRSTQARVEGMNLGPSRLSKQQNKSSFSSKTKQVNNSSFVKSNYKSPVASRGLTSRKMSQTYGRVSNPARPVGVSQGSPEQLPPPSESEQGGSSNSANNTPQSHGSYTLIPPNQKKRNQVLSQAERESKAYQSYKDSKKVNYVQTTPQSVGGSKSEEEIQRQRQREFNENRYRMQNKRREYERQKKEREEAEYREKKEKAREQTRLNQQKKQERQGTWNQDHRRTNEAFLRRVEQQSKQY
ncbi:hypothetical protein BSL78_18847 [Apostichopus japonicus]|uniref:Uncharacterized protein n=1 Tax=Stichopus japonicus TaxID=307972 RepID=A0A2G8K8L9_STIJA|nr:hypothetical protein BSL78_18847 [Apostichopus japonicus]